MSLMYKLIQEGKNQERKKIARDLLGSGVNQERVKEITGLSERKINELLFNKSQLVK